MTFVTEPILKMLFFGGFCCILKKWRSEIVKQKKQKKNEDKGVVAEPDFVKNAGMKDSKQPKGLDPHKSSEDT